MVPVNLNSDHSSDWTVKIRTSKQMTALRATIIMLAFSIKLVAQFDYQEITFIPWGTESAEAGYCQAPEGLIGPGAFSAASDSVYLLDSQNGALKLFTSGSLSTVHDLSPYSADDFLIAGNKLFLLSENSVLEFDSANILISSHSSFNYQPITGLFPGQSGNINAIINESVYSSITAYNGIHINYKIKQSTTQPLPVRILRESPHTMRVSTSAKQEFDINSSAREFGSARYLGSTPGGQLYLYIEYITRQVPLLVDREIQLYSPAGQLQAVILVPSHSYARVFREFYVDNTGNLYHLLTSTDGVHIIRWTLDQARLPVAQPFQYPPRFRDFLHYNLQESPLDDGHYQLPALPKLMPVDFPPVSRDESLAIGDTYVQHIWTASSSNLTNGEINDPYGVAIKTPAWVQVGTNQKVPYKWGGFNTLTEFDSGLLSGKYAGDCATSGVSSFCVGVDCSGFVSRCWKLPSHYSTRMMDDDIAVAYSSWTQIKPADVVHKPGHVRLAVQNNSNNTILTVEAAGADWRVSYRVFSYYDLTAYTPRYYIYMSDQPTTLQPDMASVTFDDENINLAWTVADTSNMAGYDIEFLLNDSWFNYEPTHLVPANQNSTAVNNSPGLALYYRVCTVSTDHVASSHSDCYGCLDAGSTAQILIVDGFDRWTGTASYSNPNHDFAIAIGQALENSGISFATAANDALLNNSIDPLDYAMIIWFLGDESTVDETLNDQEQTIVKTYLKNGGKLFISGSEIGWDLDDQGATTDRAFLRDYLKIQLDQDDSGNYTVAGKSGTPFAGLTIHYGNGSNGTYEEDYPDSYLAQSGAEVLLEYGNSQIAAVGYCGKFPGGDFSGAVLTMGFPFETIYDTGEQELLLAKILEYFEITPDSEPPIPVSFTLLGNYPNPFNSNTTILFTQNREAELTFKIFNLLGQQIGTSLIATYPAGTNRLSYNAGEAASGVYFYSLENDNLRETGKFVIIK